MFLVDDLLLLPTKGLLGIFKKIYEMGEREFYDESYIRGKLMELQLSLELDEISEEEYDQKEKELLTRLNAVMGADE